MQEPLNEDVPAVVPVNDPPAAGMSVGLLQAAPLRLGIVTGTDATLLPSFNSGMREKGSTVTLNV